MIPRAIDCMACVVNVSKGCPCSGVATRKGVTHAVTFWSAEGGFQACAQHRGFSAWTMTVGFPLTYQPGAGDVKHVDEGN